MEAEKYKKAQEIEKDIEELNYFRILLDSYFSGKVIDAKIIIKYDVICHTFYMYYEITSLSAS